MVNKHKSRRTILPDRLALGKLKSRFTVIISRNKKTTSRSGFMGSRGELFASVTKPAKKTVCIILIYK
jgi:hypothetical protein